MASLNSTADFSSIMDEMDTLYDPEANLLQNNNGTEIELNLRVEHLITATHEYKKIEVASKQLENPTDDPFNDCPICSQNRKPFMTNST